jgi:hypothetical protein
LFPVHVAVNAMGAKQRLPASEAIGIGQIEALVLSAGHETISPLKRLSMEAVISLRDSAHFIG